MVMGDIAVPTSQQHMTAGFMSVTMEDVVRASVVKFFFCQLHTAVPPPLPVNVDEDYLYYVCLGRAL